MQMQIGITIIEVIGDANKAVIHRGREYADFASDV